MRPPPTPRPAATLTAVIAAASVTTGVWALAAASVTTGVWALAAPHTFHAAIAPFPPYNQHLIHDIGAFQLGLGTCLALGLVARDALLVVLAGNAVGADAHAVSHLMDRHLGGHPTDPLTIGALGLLITLLALARWHHITRAAAATTLNGAPR